MYVRLYYLVIELIVRVRDDYIECRVFIVFLVFNLDNCINGGV